MIAVSFRQCRDKGMQMFLASCSQMRCHYAGSVSDLLFSALLLDWVTECGPYKKHTLKCAICFYCPLLSPPSPRRSRGHGRRSDSCGRWGLPGCMEWGVFIVAAQGSRSERWQTEASSMATCQGLDWDQWLLEAAIFIQWKSIWDTQVHMLWFQ